MDQRITHAGCCPHGEANKRHYRVVRDLFSMARVIDPNAVKEGAGLTEEPGLRPGDLTTDGVTPGKTAAVAVGVVCQAAKTGKDRVREYEGGKCDKYCSVLNKDLVRNGLVFVPAVWSQEGRPGVGAKKVLRGLSTCVARYGMGSSAKGVVRRLAREITTSLQLGLARMIRTCLGDCSDREQWLLTGHANPAVIKQHENPDEGEDWGGGDEECCGDE